MVVRPESMGISTSNLLILLGSRAGKCGCGDRNRIEHRARRALEVSDLRHTSRRRQSLLTAPVH